jgi:PAS domain S-box-containing protein
MPRIGPVGVFEHGRWQGIPAMHASNPYWPWIAEILNKFSDGIIAADSEGVVRFINPAGRRLLGVTRDEAKDARLRDILSLTDTKTGTPVALPAKRLSHKPDAARTPLQASLSRRNRDPIPVEVHIVPLDGQEENASGCAIVVRDISERLASEKTLLNRQKMDVIGQMAANIAHDFSRWLGLISGHAAAVSDSLLPKTHAHEETLRILAAAKNATGLTKRLLGLANHMKTDAKPVRVSLSEVIEDAVRSAQDSFASSVSFQSKKSKTMADVMAEPLQLFDCLMNLFRNAAEAMPQGGIVTIDAQEKKEEKKSFVVLNVRDTGCGIPEQSIRHVFEPFFSTKDPGSALGIGLTVVHNALLRWGGRVQVRSRPGRGTSVRLFIPKAEDLPGVLRREHAQASPGETVLIVDDKMSQLDEIRNALARVGYRILGATSGDSGVALFKKHAHEIGVTIIDVVMPKKDGRRVLEEVLELDPTASIIMTSGFSRDYVRGYLKRGAWGFLQKPVDTAQLVTTVRRMLDQKRASEKPDALAKV